MITYTTIIHQAREKLNLSLNEYAIADIIYQLQNNPKSVNIGWCYASKETLGKAVGITRKSVHSILNKLQKKGYIEKDGKTLNIRITPLWYETVILMKNELSEASVTKGYTSSNKRLHEGCNKRLHNNNKRDIYKINSTLTYLEEIPNKDLKEFTIKYNITERQLKEKAEVLADYCRYKGRKYKNYKAFLSNAIRKEFTKRTPKKVRKQLPEVEKKYNKEKMAKIRVKIGAMK